MNPQYKAEFDFAMASAPHVMRILEQAFATRIRIADPYSDMIEATDFFAEMQPGWAPIRIAARVRRGQWDKFIDEFTITTYSPGSPRSEFEKIMDGYGGYLFYGFLNKRDPRLRR